jgi:pimeloyl-ACP methyl ester carboxylesterase
MPRIHIETVGEVGKAGAAPPLLLLHGVGRNGRDFAPLLPWLGGRKTLLWDHRGHGRSDRAPGRYLVVDYTADVVEWLGRSEYEQIDLYGHSLGALVALRAAAEAPQRVRSLILEDPPSPGFLSRLGESLYSNNFPTMQRLAGGSQSVEAIAAELAEIRLGPAPDAKRLGDVRDAASIRFSAKCLQSVDPGVFTPIVAGRWLEGYDFDATAGAVRSPTLLMHGDVASGGMLPEADAQRFCTALPRGTVVRFSGAGHLLHWLRLEETVRAVLGFLESLGP